MNLRVQSSKQLLGPWHDIDTIPLEQAYHVQAIFTAPFTHPTQVTIKFRDGSYLRYTKEHDASLLIEDLNKKADQK